MKRLLLCISAGIITAAAISLIYSCLFDGEINYYKKANTITSLHERKIRAAGHPCYVLAGGSETKSSISPAFMLEEADIKAINTATAAGFGVASNIAIAINHLHPGDTLILGLLSTQEENIIASKNGIKLITQLYGAKAFQHDIIPLNIRNILSLFSANAGNMMVGLVRRCTRGYAYVYEKESTLHLDGWMEILRNTMQNAPLPKTIASDITFSTECSVILQKTMAACKKIQADFLVMLPVGFTNEYETKRRLMHALQLTRMGIPVLRDERLGRTPDNTLYSDTMFHMNAEGTEQNSRIIARLLKEKRYWTEQELLEQMNARGFTEDATPQK